MISVTIDSLPEDIGSLWNDLIQRASSNVFMHPAALQAARATEFANVRTLLAWDEGAGTRSLAGLWALRLRKIAPFWPAVLEALPYDYAFLSSPVIDPAHINEVVPAFLTAVEQSPSLPDIISLHSFDAESPAYEAMQREIASRGLMAVTLEETARPVVSRDFGVKRSGSTRKKLRQDWNRLAALGSVEVVNDRTTPAAELAFEIFLKLEQASWKGANGTALLSDPRDAAFVRQMLCNLAAQGNASVALLIVNGEAIAAQVLMYCGATAYTWKTAFSSAFSKYSPGALLVDKVTDELLSGPEIQAIDSCSTEAGFMAQLWAGRRNMVDMLIDLDPGQSMTYRLEAGRQLTLRQLRHWRHRLREGSSQRPARNRAARLANTSAHPILPG